MPRTPIDYQTTIIYKIVTTADIVLYIGCTTDFIKTKNRIKAMSSKTDMPKGKYSKLWRAIHDAGGWDNIIMLEIEKYPCSDARQAEAEVFRLQQEYRIEQLNKQFKADEEKISKGGHIDFKHKVKKPTLNYRC